MIDIVIALIMAFSLILSINSINISQDANRIAIETKDITYNYYLPAIKPMLINNSQSSSKYSGEIDIYNGGGRIRVFDPLIHTICNIIYSNYQKNTYITFYQYYDGAGEESANFEGLLWKYMITNGHDRFDKLSSEFNNSSKENYSDASLNLTITLHATYYDFYNKYHSEYYNVLTSDLMDTETTSTILNEANTNSGLASKFGLSMWLSDTNIDGSKLFQFWYSNLRK